MHLRRRPIMGLNELSGKSLLSRLGADNTNFIFEVIVTTCDTSGLPNAAPMGIQFMARQDNPYGYTILLRPYKSTTTYRNLLSLPEAVINVTLDPMLFYLAAFKHKITRSKSKIAFYPAKTVKPPRVRDCDAYIEVSAESRADARHERRDRSQIPCQIKSVEVQNPEAKLYSRAPYVLIEAIIHTTRANELRSQGLMNEADELERLVNSYRKLIQRVAPSSAYEEIAEELVRFTNAGEKGIDSNTEKNEGED
jgi:hypothetical protein